MSRQRRLFGSLPSVPSTWSMQQLTKEMRPLLCRVPALLTGRNPFA